MTCGFLPELFQLWREICKTQHMGCPLRIKGWLREAVVLLPLRDHMVTARHCHRRILLGLLQQVAVVPALLLQAWAHRDEMRSSSWTFVGLRVGDL